MSILELARKDFLKTMNDIYLGDDTEFNNSVANKGIKAMVDECEYLYEYLVNEVDDEDDNLEYEELDEIHQSLADFIKKYNRFCK